MSASLRNPFDLVKASDFSDEDISKYWVDIAGEAGLEELFRPSNITPMLLLGGKGSGKTHLMRYFSFPVRRLRNGVSLRQLLREDGYLGIYVQADGLNVGRFEGKGLDAEQWGGVFSYYVELWLATQFLRNIRDVVRESDIAFDELAFVRSVAFHFAGNLPGLTNLGELADYITSLRKEVDHIVGNIATRRRTIDEIDVRLTPGALVYGLPEAFHESCPSTQPLFVYLIDEIENFNEAQQKFLNSLIRYRRGPASIKVGARLYGLRTRDTWGGSGEKIRIGSEFTQVELDQWLRGHSEAYGEFARKMVVKRLESAGVARVGAIEPKDIDQYFEEISRDSYYQKPTLAMVEKYDRKGALRPYLSDLRDNIRQWGTSQDRADAEKIVDTLKRPEHPLLEKVNAYLLYRDWVSDQPLLKTASDIRDWMVDVLNDSETKGAADYKDTYEHFSSDFLAQLSRDCKVQRIDYAGFAMLLHLSQGFPRNLIGLLNQIYRRSLFAGEQPFAEYSFVSIAVQNEGVRDAAEWFWDDAQPDSHGPESRSAMSSLAELFAGIRFSPKPAECSVGSFTVQPGAGSDRAREVLEYAKNWSYLIQIKGVGSDRNNSDAVDDKYQLSPMLAPRWDVSEKRRGAIRLSEEMFNAIFDPSYRERLRPLISARLAGMQNPAHGDQRQEHLFL